MLNGGGRVGGGNLCLFENEEGGHRHGCFVLLGFFVFGFFKKIACSSLKRIIYIKEPTQKWVC